jgi:predicted transcriptional regulator
MRENGSLSEGVGPQQQPLSPTDLTAEQIRAWRVRHFGNNKGAIKACAMYLGVSRFTVHAYERGAWQPRLAVAHRMAALERDPEAREVLEALERLRRAKGVRR